MDKVYYLDGYHGGVYGHMPLGSVRDVLDTLKEHPDWKVNFEIEPVSYEFLKDRDPEAYEEITKLVKEGKQMEIVSGSYGQPYGWITDGESNIRHLVLGRKTLKKHFPDTDIESYVVQEPCWSSFLPQVLVQLGYKQASLKDASTAWGGYCEPYVDENGNTAEIVNWAGPDGTFIPTIPRYACEDAVCVFATEARDAEKEYMEKCIENGIASPTGMNFQDLGWRARKAIQWDHIEFSLIKDYFKNKASKNRPYWQPGQEIFRGALPWGDRTLVEVARQVRRLERELTFSERLTAFSTLYGNETNEEKLTEAWEYLLLSQHHDGWICASSGSGEYSWRRQTSARVFAAENIISKLDRKAFDYIKASLKDADDEDFNTVTVFNPLAKKEKRLISVDMTAHKGTMDFEVYDGDEKLISQAVNDRKYRDSSYNAGKLLFEAELPAFGFKTFKIKAIKEEAISQNKIALIENDDFITLENKLIKVTFSKKHGGAITSYFDKKENREIVPENQFFNEFKGYFIDENRFCSNTEFPAECTVNFTGDVKASITFNGTISKTPYRLYYTLEANSPYLDVTAAFNFPENTLIGEPHEMDDDLDAKILDPHRAYHDGRYRLNAYFPTTFKQKYIDKDCAYDVCRSKLTDTHFKTWYEIKHNILIHWVDTTDEENGLCILADHTTAYTHGEDENLGLALAWGYDGGFWWGRRPLGGWHQLSYRILPHKGSWKEAKLWHECDKFLYNPLSKRSVDSFKTNEYSLLSIDTENIELGAFYTANGEYYLRAFNIGENTEAEFTIDKNKFSGILRVNPEGVVCGDALEEKNGKFIDTIPSFGIRTYKLIK